MFCLLYLDKYTSSNASIETKIAILSWFATVVAIIVLTYVMLSLNKKIIAKSFVIIIFLQFVLIILTYAKIYQTFGVLDLVENKLVHVPSTCLYLSVITITTVGYGDVVPALGWGRWVAMTEALFGYLLMGVLVATLIDVWKPTDPR